MAINFVDGKYVDEKGIVKLDIDLLMYDDTVLKPKDMEICYVQEGLVALAK